MDSLSVQVYAHSFVNTYKKNKDAVYKHKYNPIDGVHWVASYEGLYKDASPFTMVVFCKFPFPIILFRDNYGVNIYDRFFQNAGHPTCMFDGYKFKRKVINNSNIN